MHYKQYSIPDGRVWTKEWRICLRRWTVQVSIALNSVERESMLMRLVGDAVVPVDGVEKVLGFAHDPNRLRMLIKDPLVFRAKKCCTLPLSSFSRLFNSMVEFHASILKS